MNLLRRAAVAILGSVLLFALLAMAWSHIASSTLGNRETVKSWLSDSGFYDNVVESVLENAVDQSGEGDDVSIPADDPEIQAVAQDAFSSDFLKNSVEEVLDGTYAWLEGKTDKPEFSVDLSEAKQQLADGIGSYAARRAAELPACSTAQLQEMQANGFDALSSECLPPGVNPQTAGEDLSKQIATSEDFLGDTTFNGDDLLVGDNDEKVTLDQAPEFKQVQTSFGWLNNALYVFAAIAILSAIGIILLSANKRKGISRFGTVILTAGVLLGVSLLLINRGSAWLNQRASDLGGESSASREIAANMASAVSSDVARLLLWYAVGFAVVGVACILGAKFINRPEQKNNDPDNDPDAQADANESDATESTSDTETPAETAKPTKNKPRPPRKIQL